MEESKSLKAKLTYYHFLSKSTNNFIQGKKAIYDISKLRKGNQKLKKLFNLENIIHKQRSKDNILIDYINSKKINFKSFEYKIHKSYDSAKITKRNRNVIKSQKFLGKANSNPNLSNKNRKKIKKFSLSVPNLYYIYNDNSNSMKKNNSNKNINNYSRNKRNFIIEKFVNDEEKISRHENKTLSSIINYIRVNRIKIHNNSEMNNIEISTDNSSKGIRSEVKKQKTENNIFLDKNYQKNRFQINSSKSFNGRHKIMNDIFTNEKQKEYNDFIVKKKNIIIENEKNENKSSSNEKLNWVNRLYNNEIKKNKIKKQLILNLRKSLLKNNKKSKSLNKTDNQIDVANEKWMEDENYCICDYGFFNDLNKNNKNINYYNINKNCYNKNSEIKKNLSKKNCNQKIKKSVCGKNTYNNLRLNSFIYNNELINEEDEEKENEDNEI